MAKWGVKDAKDEIGYPIYPYNRGKYEVDEIETFKYLMESHLMLYCWGDERAERVMKPFEDELDDYPSHGSHDDTLITAVQAQSKLIPRGDRKVKVHRGRVSGHMSPSASSGDPGSLDDLARMLSEMNETLKELHSYGTAAR